MIVYVVLCVFAALLLFGVRNMLVVHRDLQNSDHALGTTVRQIGNGSSDGATYHSVIAFEVGGTTYEHVTSWSSSPPTYDVGEQVHIACARSDPSRSRVATAAGAYGTAYIMTLLGATGMRFCLGMIHSDRVMRWLHPHLR